MATFWGEVSGTLIAMNSQVWLGFKSISYEIMAI